MRKQQEKSIIEMVYMERTEMYYKNLISTTFLMQLTRIFHKTTNNRAFENNSNQKCNYSIIMCNF